MNRSTTLRLAPLLATTLLTGCMAAVGSEQYSALDAGFASVQAGASKSINKRTVWVQSQAEAQANSRRVHDPVTRKPTGDIEVGSMFGRCAQNQV